jgi:hypothetical protein
MSIGSRKTTLTTSNGRKESKREKLMIKRERLRKQNTRRETKKGKNRRSSEHIWDKLSLSTNLSPISTI